MASRSDDQPLTAEGIRFLHFAQAKADALPDSADTRLHQPGMADLGRRREGWRGRLAHVEMLLTKAEEWFVPGSEPLEPLGQALAEVRAMIDEA
jgi:hypothetical protein